MITRSKYKITVALIGQNPCNWPLCLCIGYPPGKQYYQGRMIKQREERKSFSGIFLKVIWVCGCVIHETCFRQLFNSISKYVYFLFSGLTSSSWSPSPSCSSCSTSSTGLPLSSRTICSIFVRKLVTLVIRFAGSWLWNWIWF